MRDDEPSQPSPSSRDADGGGLLAVDLGLRTGLAWFDAAGRLAAYRSQHFGSRERLRRGSYGVVCEQSVRWLAVEGDAALGRVWARAGRRIGATTLRVTAEQWRMLLLHPSERRSGTDAKRVADRLARLVIGWSDLKRPTSLRHDAAEAVCVGLWGALEVGLLDSLPPPLDPARRRT